MLSLLINLAHQVALVLTALGAGLLTLEILRAASARPKKATAPPWPVVFALGLAVVSALLFFVAVAKLYRPWILQLFTAASAVATLLVWSRSRARSAHSPERLELRAATPVRTGARIFLISVLLTVLAGLWLQANRPDVAHDAAVYHLRIPEQMLAADGFRPFPWNVYAHWPHAMQLIWGQALSLGRHEGAKLLHWTCLVAVLLLTARLSNGARRTWAMPGLLAAGLFLATPVVLFESRIAYVDLAFALFFLAGFWVIADATTAVDPGAPERAGSRQHLGSVDSVALGLLIAGLVTVKLTGVVAATALLLLVATRLPPPWASNGRRRWAWCTLPALALGAAWLIKTWWFTGNPVYPLLWSHFGGDHWSAELAQRHALWNQSIGMGRSPLDYLLLPWRLLVHADLGYSSFDGVLGAAWWVATPLALLGAWRSARARQALAAAAVFSLGWALTSQQLRLLIPALPLIAVAAGIGLASILLRSEEAARGVSPIVLPAALRDALHPSGAALVGSLMLVQSWVYLEQAPRLATDLVRGGRELRQAVEPQVNQWINERTPADARVLMLGINRGFGIERELVIDSFFEASQIAWEFRDAEDADAALLRAADLGITHAVWTGTAPRIGYPSGLVALVERRLREPGCRLAADRGAALVALQCRPPT